MGCSEAGNNYFDHWLSVRMIYEGETRADPCDDFFRWFRCCWPLHYFIFLGFSSSCTDVSSHEVPILVHPRSRDKEFFFFHLPVWKQHNLIGFLHLIGHFIFFFNFVLKNGNIKSCVSLFIVIMRLIFRADSCRKTAAVAAQAVTWQKMSQTFFFYFLSAAIDF